MQDLSSQLLIPQLLTKTCIFILNHRLRALDSMGGGAWSFLVGGAIYLVNSVNERDLNLLTSYVKVSLCSQLFREIVVRSYLSYTF